MLGIRTIEAVQGVMHPLEWTAGAVVAAVGVVAILVGRGWAYLIVLAIGTGTVIAIRSVMRCMLQDAIEYGAQSQARWALRAAEQRPGPVAPVYDLVDRRDREPVNR